MEERVRIEGRAFPSTTKKYFISKLKEGIISSSG
jgi:hypothetical protein